MISVLAKKILTNNQIQYHKSMNKLISIYILKNKIAYYLIINSLWFYNCI